MKLNSLKPKLVTITLCILIFALVSVGFSCFGGSKRYAGMMAMVPVDSTHYSYWAIDKLGADDDLWTLYVKFRESTAAMQLRDIEPVLAVVKRSAKASGFEGSVTVLEGDFNTKDLERRMRNEGYARSVYREVDIWTPEGETGYLSVAVKGSAVLMGTEKDLRSCIDVIRGDQNDSLYEDQGIRWVTDRLPEGLIVGVFRAGPGSEEQHTDLIAYGRSYSKDGKDRMRMTAVYMFRDGYAADPAQVGIRDYLTNQDFTNVELKQDGNFIRVTALVYISDLTQSISY